MVVAWRSFGLNAVLAFWTAYIVTRPLGASIGDFLTQTAKDGGLGLGPFKTTTIFLATILTPVVYLTRNRKDQIVLTEPVPESI